MKSLQILPSLEVGGVERGVVDLGRALKNKGDELVVISSGGSLVAELHKLGITHYSLPVHRKSLFSLLLVDQIAAIIEREHAEVVHARSRVPAWLAWLASRKARVPFVTTCHGYYSTHALSRVMGWGKRVIVISRAVGRHMIDDFGVAPERIRLIHRGIDFSGFTFDVSKYKARPLRPRIVNIGRFSPIKGQLEFLKAVYLVRRECPDLEVWLVGEEGKGKHKYTEALQRMIRELGLDACVKLTGTRRDIPEILRQAHLLVLSTIVPEAFGRVLVEAAASGTAVVATRVGGVPDIVDDGENGLLVPAGDINAMAGAVAGLLKDQNRCLHLASRLNEKVRERFTLEEMAEKTRAVYEEVKKEKRILVFKLGAMGDLVLATPSLRMLQVRFPGAKIFLAVSKKLASLVSRCPYIYQIIPVDRDKLNRPRYLLKFAKNLRREGFDFSVDLQNSKWTHLAAFLGAAPLRFGFCKGPFAFLLNRGEKKPPFAEPPVKNQFRILSKLGVSKFDERLELWPDERAENRGRELLPDSAESHRPAVGFVVGASPKWPSKCWPADSFRKLAARLAGELGCRIVLLGAQAEEEDARKIMEGAGPETINLAGKTSPQELAAVMRRLDLVVTGDTAPLHMAAALRTRIVALFGPTDPVRHMPPAEDAVVISRRLSCRPCYRGKCSEKEPNACLARVSVEEVFETAKKLLQKGNTSPVCPARPGRSG